ncbi:MAG: methyltransferase domain-containing protein [Chloroflexi bacterium]|nr:methyltransferase domain-containing protein [Chloroflexota bacterium]
MSSKAYFDKVANQWDQMRTSFFSKEVRDEAYAVAGVRAGESAADIGAGTGFIAEGLRERGLNVIAVDHSEAMLAELRKRFDGIDCRLGGEDHLPITSAAVDYAFANMYLHHVENPAAAIGEMARTVKPGGKLVITDLDEHTFEFLRTEQYDRWMGFRREDVRRWFEHAGLRNVVVDCVGANCCADSSCGSEHANVSIFVASGEK